METADQFRRPAPEKTFWKAVQADPLPIVGTVVTVGILGLGIMSMVRGNPQLSQKLMRARVLAQAATVGFVLLSMGGYSWGRQKKGE